MRLRLFLFSFTYDGRWQPGSIRLPSSAYTSPPFWKGVVVYQYLQFNHGFPYHSKALFHFTSVGLLQPVSIRLPSASYSSPLLNRSSGLSLFCCLILNFHFVLKLFYFLLRLFLFLNRIKILFLFFLFIIGFPAPSEIFFFILNRSKYPPCISMALSPCLSSIYFKLNIFIPFI